MRTAVNDVAKSIEGDAEQIKSDLLSQLRNHQQQTQEKKMEQTPSTTLRYVGGLYFLYPSHMRDGYDQRS